MLKLRELRGLHEHDGGWGAAEVVPVSVEEMSLHSLVKGMRVWSCPKTGAWDSKREDERDGFFWE